MAKSLRAKTKQANRRKKRQDVDSHYAAVEASRVQRVSDRLLGKDKEAAVDGEGSKEASKGEAEGADEEVDEDMEEASKPKKISTSGPRQNRRESWRESKGMPARTSAAGQNKQLKQIAKRKPGRNKRRR